ncbi:MAG: hypothetical protein JWQ50_1786 [Caballeronia mineralivorans]|nr:hypothetical protein [Caballeronia mineralivorans]
MPGNQTSDFLPPGTTGLSAVVKCEQTRSLPFEMISTFICREEVRFACYMLTASNKPTLPTGGYTVSVARWDRGRRGLARTGR